MLKTLRERVIEAPEKDPRLAPPLSLVRLATDGDREGWPGFTDVDCPRHLKWQHLYS